MHKTKKKLMSNIFTLVSNILQTMSKTFRFYTRQELDSLSPQKRFSFLTEPRLKTRYSIEDVEAYLGRELSRSEAFQFINEGEIADFGRYDLIPASTPKPAEFVPRPVPKPSTLPPSAALPNKITFDSPDSAIYDFDEDDTVTVDYEDLVTHDYEPEVELESYPSHEYYSDDEYTTDGPETEATQQPTQAEAATEASTTTSTTTSTTPSTTVRTPSSSTTEVDAEASTEAEIEISTEVVAEVHTELPEQSEASVSLDEDREDSLSISTLSSSREEAAAKASFSSSTVDPKRYISLTTALAALSVLAKAALEQEQQVVNNQIVAEPPAPPSVEAEQPSTLAPSTLAPTPAPTPVLKEEPSEIESVTVRAVKTVTQKVLEVIVKDSMGASNSSEKTTAGVNTQDKSYTLFRIFEVHLPTIASTAFVGIICMLVVSCCLRLACRHYSTYRAARRDRMVEQHFAALKKRHNEQTIREFQNMRTTEPLMAASAPAPAPALRAPQPITPIEMI